MSLSKFLTDVGNISALSIKPNSIDGLTAEQLQQKFDKAGVDFKNYIDNTLTEELDSKHEIIDENCGTATDTYSSSSTYAINDISIYQNKIYRCITAITVPEEFNGSKWVQTSLKALSIPSKTVDANGWTVWNYGNRKEWTKKGTVNGILGGNLWHTISGVALPVGLSTIGTNILSTSLLSSDSAISLNAGCNTTDSLIYIQAVNIYNNSINVNVFYQFRIVQN